MYSSVIMELSKIIRDIYMLKKSFITASLLLVCSTQFLSADGLYGKFGIGYSMPSKQDIKSSSSNGIDFKNGAEVQLAIGYQIDSLRFEGEYSYSKFDMDKLYTSTSTESIDGDMRVDSLLANAIYDFDIDFVLKPYIGVGLGLSRVTWDMTGISEHDDVFTYQGFLGMTYVINDNTNFDIQYKYKDISDYSIVNNSNEKGTILLIVLM